MAAHGPTRTKGPALAIGGPFGHQRTCRRNKTPGAAIRAAAKQLSPITPLAADHLSPPGKKPGSERPNRQPQSGLNRRRKQIPSEGFPREGFGCRRVR